MRRTKQIAAKTAKLDARLTDKARKLREHEMLTLSGLDRQVFVDTLLLPVLPSKRLREAARRYKGITGN
jgi:uncharacterized protein (DUF1778 family)